MWKTNTALKVILVDVRQPEELLTDGEIPGSVNVPLQASSTKT